MTGRIGMRPGLPADPRLRIIAPSHHATQQPSPHGLRAAPGRVAQLVEQGIENPRVGGSIPSPATIDFNKLRSFGLELES